MRLEEIHMRPEEMLDYVKECCASNWNRPASMFVEFSIDYFDKGITVTARDRGCNARILIPFVEIEKFGAPAILGYLSSINRKLRCGLFELSMYNNKHEVYYSFELPRNERKVPKIKRVIFNDPATIVFWGDNTKTIVKAENETFDAEKGLAMAIAKKALGNKGNYYDELKKYLGDDYETEI